MRIRIHYNKNGASSGLPWSVHTSKACIPASHVRILVPVETEERPDRPSNPRYFMRCNGNIRKEGDVVIIE